MLTKVRFAKILKIVVKNCIDTAITKNGFRASGLCPFDPNAVDYTKCLGKNNSVENEENETNNNSYNSDTIAIDLKRFQEIVGEKKLLSLSKFDYEKPCSSDFALLHMIFKELSSSNNQSTLMSDETVDAGTEIQDSTVEQLSDVIIVETMSPEVVENLNDFEIINMADVTVLDPKEVTLEKFLTVPLTPTRKCKKNSESRQRQFVITSEINKMEEEIKIEEKIAKQKALEERKRKLEEGKLKLDEKKQKLEERKKKLEENKEKAETSNCRKEKNG